MTDDARILRIHPADNVAVALGALTPGATYADGAVSVTAAEVVPSAHKIALTAIAVGDAVIKYGQPIGRASAAIEAGRHVHVHNVRSALDEPTDAVPSPPVESTSEAATAATFEGYVRPDGRVGVRNEIWILPTVGCVNRIAEALARTASIPDGVDGVYAFGHPLGCSQLGDDHRRTQQILAALVGHPNAAAVLVVGLGCENNNIDEFRKMLGPVDPARVAFLNTQDVDDEIGAGLDLIDALADRAAAAKRETVSLDRLCVGLKCGGSDGLSGVTANPLVGAVCDRLTSAGAAAVLTEVPEMFGAEAVLAARCADQDLWRACEGMIDDFKAYFTAHGQPIDKNPSPGNLAGGITTLAEKSLGCVQKAGRAPITAAVGYGERVAVGGVNLLDGPGNDMVAVTNLAAAGAQVILFTTGRGTPLGGPVPTMKIATNSELAAKKAHWIDFDAGRLLTGADAETLADELLADLLTIASGRAEAANERAGYREIAIFTDGVTL